LDVVRVKSRGLAYLRKLPAWDSVLDIRLFHFDHAPVIDDVDDDRNTPASDDFRRAIEAGDFDVNGVEVQLSLRPSRGSLLRLDYA